MWASIERREMIHDDTIFLNCGLSISVSGKLIIFSVFLRISIFTSTFIKHFRSQDAALHPKTASWYNTSPAWIAKVTWKSLAHEVPSASAAICEGQNLQKVLSVIKKQITIYFPDVTFCIQQVNQHHHTISIFSSQPTFCTLSSQLRFWKLHRRHGRLGQTGRR